MTLMNSKLLRGAVVAGLALSPMAAFAQASDTTPGAEPAETTTEAPAVEAGFTDAQLESFVTATLAMQDVRSSYVPQFEAAEDDAARQQLAEEANAEMVAAVEAADGIDVPTYNEIGRAAQSDEALNARLVAMVKDRVETPGNG